MRALKLQATVNQNGRLTLPKLPLRKGSEVEVIILERDSLDDELLKAARSSMDFWDNPVDDANWNDG